GSFDAGTGSLDVDVPLEVTIHAGASADQPCPACVTLDGVANLGEDGVCAGGPRSGSPCRVGGLADPRFGTAAGTSVECPPSPAIVGFFPLTTAVTTGEVRWALGDDSPACVGSALPGRKCHCPAVPGELTRPDACLGDGVSPTSCLPTEAGEGYCSAGPVDHICADQPWRYCAHASHCVTGECIARLRPCFPDPIVRTGHADS